MKCRCKLHAAVEDSVDRSAKAISGQGSGTQRQLTLLNMVADPKPHVRLYSI
jgi:hypothetical protein